MKKVIILICTITLVFGLTACKKEMDLTQPDQTKNKISQQNEQKNLSEGKLEIAGLIVQDGEDLILITNGNQIRLIANDSLFDYVDKKVKVEGDYTDDGKLFVTKIQVQQKGRLFYSVNNLYLNQNDGSHILLQGSVVPELKEKYLGREAEVLGSFIDEKNYKFKIAEYYIQGVKTDVYQQYQNQQFGFELKYPAGWTKTEEEIDVNGQALNVIFNKNNEEIVLILQKDIPRPALSAENIEKKILPSGLVVNVYYDQDAQQGKDLTKVIFDLPNSNYDFYLAGYGSEFNQMYLSIELFGNL